MPGPTIDRPFAFKGAELGADILVGCVNATCRMAALRRHTIRIICTGCHILDDGWSRGPVSRAGHTTGQYDEKAKNGQNHLNLPPEFRCHVCKIYDDEYIPAVGRVKLKQ
jgi:hypothetical protein